MADVPVLLLAAGGSSRMGTPKPLLKWGAQTLIEYQVQNLLRTGQPVAIVLGAQAEKVRPILKKFPVTILVNATWNQGMGNSIAFGTTRIISEFPGAAGMLVALLDQPLIAQRHFEHMFQAFKPGSEQIIASLADSGWRGVPVLFDQIYFKSLQSLKGDEGAKKIIRQHPTAVEYIKCEDVLDDMDTPESYRRLLDIYKELY